MHPGHERKPGLLYPDQTTVGHTEWLCPAFAWISSPSLCVSSSNVQHDTNSSRSWHLAAAHLCFLPCRTTIRHRVSHVLGSCACFRGSKFGSRAVEHEKISSTAIKRRQGNASVYEESDKSSTRFRFQARDVLLCFCVHSTRHNNQFYFLCFVDNHSG